MLSLGDMLTPAYRTDAPRPVGSQAMPFYVLGGIPPQLPLLPRARAVLLRGVTVVGGPFATQQGADAFMQGYLPAQHQHSETVLGVVLPVEHYTVSASADCGSRQSRYRNTAPSPGRMA